MTPETGGFLDVGGVDEKHDHPAINAVMTLRRGLVITLKSFAIMAGILAAIFVVGSLFAARGNGTHYRPLATDEDDILLTDAHMVLGALPMSSGSERDSVRFAVMPSLGQKWYAVELIDSEGLAKLSVAVLDLEKDTVTTQIRTIPDSAYAELSGDLDRRAEYHWGDAKLFTDGIVLAFERRKNGKTFSGIGNSPCHYGAISNELASALAPYVPELGELFDPGIQHYVESESCTGWRALI